MEVSTLPIRVRIYFVNARFVLVCLVYVSV